MSSRAGPGQPPRPGANHGPLVSVVADRPITGAVVIQLRRSHSATVIELLPKRRFIHYALWALAALLVSGPMLAVALGDAPLGRDWRNASQESVGLAPEPSSHRL